MRREGEYLMRNADEKLQRFGRCVANACLDAAELEEEEEELLLPKHVSEMAQDLRSLLSQAAATFVDARAPTALCSVLVALLEVDSCIGPRGAGGGSGKRERGAV